MILHSVMSNHMDLLTELPFLERLPTPDRLRAAKKRRAQQLKKWAQYEKEMQNKKRKTDKKKSTGNRQRVSFAPNITLLEASSRNDIEEVSLLLRKNVNPDLCNEDGLTALHQSCIDNFEEMVRLLLDQGTNVDAKDNELWTPLHAAATCRHTNLVKILIERGADLLAVNADGNMPYDLCDDDRTLELIETAMVNQGITQEKIDQTRTAVEQQMIVDIREGIQTGTDLNARDVQGATLLHVVAANGYYTVAELLLEHGAKINIKDQDGWEPLHAAACWGQMQIAELLTAHGASLNAKTHLKETPIDLCDDEEFKVALRQLKHKHENILKSQGKNKSSLCRRTSSAGSRGTVVRRASVTDRNNLYRKECEQEAIIWQQMGRKEMEKEVASSDGEDKESSKDQENLTPNLSSKSQKCVTEQVESTEEPEDVCGKTSLPVSTPTSQQPSTNTESLGTPPTAERANGRVFLNDCHPAPSPQPNRDRNCQTLSELKRQRAATKLKKQMSQEASLANGLGSILEIDQLQPKSSPVGSRTSEVSSNGNSLYCYQPSGDPPLLRLKAPLEEPDAKEQSCCRIV
ncbi:protein phosphatase 1 regulatory inhibitor subunit 16B-like [Carcharodon carcharias]|uniref:protein phosphatase 1 regulatory inhibitor subunit 16B-like n=1 Tax=Carcharodon carcharias TaxID=13397 RepID=UPI001B7E1723|nr:protein phosphatase 1 regulatory inhibitor subunit 16B-like [Carcharodon carcharias]XP_041061336.1 protein phosphatase 1 regulatory inhibitor subunit 16B-like [Carcharodon carcharias]XP_041061337.1 protein phosphatase 1 regulatory inhibitor subunit 16B-like [Carcharodon carcharias]